MPTLDILPRNGRFFVFDRTRLLADFPTRQEAEHFVLAHQARKGA